jgi:hypothetical protein
MEKNTQIQGSQLSHLHLPRHPNRTSPHIPLRAAEARRSVDNILRWNSYLGKNPYPT